ncbi:MAG: hypothetical protein OQK04_12885 [Kangiellaceae bacterium]|nr:hypothetical protein [Kangiellaceae bacterium]MCW8999595.1 hypothetical protein [Kangiellaceae bacterium]
MCKFRFMVRFGSFILVLILGMNSLESSAFTSLPQKKESKVNTPSIEQQKISNHENAEKAQVGKEIVSQSGQSFQFLQQQLNLSELQKKKIRPVLEESSRLRAKVLQKHRVKVGEIAGLSFMKKIALGKDLKEVRSTTLKQLEDILSPRQLETYKKLSRAYIEQIKDKL